MTRARKLLHRTVNRVVREFDRLKNAITAVWIGLSLQHRQSIGSDIKL